MMTKRRGKREVCGIREIRVITPSTNCTPFPSFTPQNGISSSIEAPAEAAAAAGARSWL